MDLVAYTVAWAGENNAVLGCDLLQISMVISVPEIVLQHVMVNET
jgi:hypothetical protein